MIKRELREEDVDYILDASQYPQPLSLFTIAYPDKLMLNLKLPVKQAIDCISKDMQDCMEVNQGMIISNPETYYMSLCSTLGSDYTIDQYLSLELIPGVVAKQQLN